MKLLKDLYEIYAPSNGEKKIKKFIKNWVSDNIPDAKIRRDNNDGNIYIVRGEAKTYPCVVAHLDQVQRKHSADFIAVETEDIIFGYSPSKRTHEGLGADDKNGIWVALKCLEEFDTIKVAFFVGEEIGCVGSGRCDIGWFSDCRFIVQPDRKGAFDLITDIWGRICSNDFEFDIDAGMFGYRATSGMMTDVLTLSELNVGVSCINLSCGYYEPHTDKEFTVKADLENCLNFVRHIIMTAVDVYPHSYNTRYQKLTGTTDVTSPKPDTTFKAYDEPRITYISEYSSLETYVDELMWQNFEDFCPTEVLPYVQSDLDLYGITDSEFLELAWEYYDFYWEQYYNDDDTLSSYSSNK